ALQDDARREDMMLMLDYGIFYEFIPMEELDKEQPKVLTLQQVELHKNYALVISTDGGLWRYKIGDTVKLTSLSPHRIQISGRTKHNINAFGEELMVENADVAISRACQSTQATITDFTACPIYIGDGTKGGHEWIIEFEKEPENLFDFVEILDKTLREVNSDYDAKRYQDIALQKPIVHSVPTGTFHEWLKRKGKLGGQHKVPRLANTREYVEDILKHTSIS
ncbi:MAG: GH3 auxin-responsive promoter family protein, partial [Raineya sp.]